MSEKWETVTSEEFYCTNFREIAERLSIVGGYLYRTSLIDDGLIDNRRSCVSIVFVPY